MSARKKFMHSSQGTPKKNLYIFSVSHDDDAERDEQFNFVSDCAKRYDLQLSYNDLYHYWQLQGQTPPALEAAYKECMDHHYAAHLKTSAEMKRAVDSIHKISETRPPTISEHIERRTQEQQNSAATGAQYILRIFPLTPEELEKANQSPQRIEVMQDLARYRDGEDVQEAHRLFDEWHCNTISKQEADSLSINLKHKHNLLFGPADDMAFQLVGTKAAIEQAQQDLPAHVASESMPLEKYQEALRSKHEADKYETRLQAPPGKFDNDSPVIH